MRINIFFCINISSLRCEKCIQWIDLWMVKEVNCIINIVHCIWNTFAHCSDVATSYVWSTVANSISLALFVVVLVFTVEKVKSWKIQICTWLILTHNNNNIHRYHPIKQQNWNLQHIMQDAMNKNHIKFYIVLLFYAIKNIDEAQTHSSPSSYSIDLHRKIYFSHASI